ncbi:hypothetical protein [Planctomyces sp. SH-PL62]|uniref:hypothetical protein n=1 Tax=Planctomyces sp. SH-PL62 TaxID=1636152 RepID=UPI00078C69C7|nr:hypothetical protein [Planctomyces sp. SH-PL62]AMV40357.1 hypothetical protein VT85_23195 [Planctomyces sp. SH-PL62]
MKERKVDIGKAFREVTLIEAAIGQAAREAATLHKRLGLPLVSWRNNQVVHIPPEEIDLVNWTHEVGDEDEDDEAEAE